MVETDDTENSCIFEPQVLISSGSNEKQGNHYGKTKRDVKLTRGYKTDKTDQRRKHPPANTKTSNNNETHRSELNGKFCRLVTQ